MNYLAIYNSIIDKALNREEPSLYEKHHIIPKSIQTIQVAQEILQRNKLVKLTPREHFIAHLLLVKIFQGNDSNCYQKTLFAANMLRSRIKNSTEYEWLRIRFREMMSRYMKGKPSRAKGKQWSETAKQLKSLKHYMKGRTYEEIYGIEKAKDLKIQRSLSRKGKKLEEFLKDPTKAEELRRSSARPRTPEWRAKISKSRKGYHITEATRDKLQAFLRDNLKNPAVDQTLYKFENVHTGEIVIARQIDMKKQYKCCLMHRIMRDKTKTSKGWRLVGLA